MPVLLSRLDSNEVKKLTDLATSENDTFILLTNETIMDMNFNPHTPVTTPHPVSNYTEDETRPILEWFVVDMDLRTLYLSFSEMVNISSLSVEDKTLQDGRLAMEPTLTLYPPTFSRGDNEPVIPIVLSVYDANLLTSLTHLYNTINDSYLTLTNMTVCGNNLEAVEDGNGM